MVFWTRPAAGPAADPVHSSCGCGRGRGLGSAPGGGVFLAARARVGRHRDSGRVTLAERNRARCRPRDHWEAVSGSGVAEPALRRPLLHQARGHRAMAAASPARSRAPPAGTSRFTPPVASSVSSVISLASIVSICPSRSLQRKFDSASQVTKGVHKASATTQPGAREAALLKPGPPDLYTERSGELRVTQAIFEVRRRRAATGRSAPTRRNPVGATWPHWSHRVDQTPPVPNI